MSVDFGRACGDLFTTEQKWITLLCLSVCMLIPIVGQMVVIGYAFRRAARVREGKAAEDFDFQYFAEYLKLGVWPFLATLVLSLVLLPATFAIMLVPAIGVPLLGNDGGAAGAILVAGAFVLFFATFFAYLLVSFPVLLRSGLRMQFQAGFSVRFIADFLGRVGVSLFLWFLLLLLIAVPLQLVGFLALYVGGYIVAAWMQYAMVVLAFQHYDLYLERGAQPVEVHPELTRDYGVSPLPPHTDGGDVT